MSEDREIKKGGISVETNHIFPIIKKWLYSEKDIFLREIVSNAADAITKYKRLISLGETAEPETPFRIDVTADKDAGTLTVSDNGIGMTSDEVEKYICSIALSGALDFIQKYEGENGDTAGNGIIGHFGLGFYSSFMVSDKVEVLTKSYTGAPAVRWVCNEAGEYEMSPCDKETVGTDVVMHINDDEDYDSFDKVVEILRKYCSFMPVEIYAHNANADKKDEKEEPINETLPLWQKPASECTKEEYIEFYHKVFADMRDPLFWIHINADYPLNFKGILFFPKIGNEYESIEGQVKLYYNQVFVADNIKEVIPEYLLMLKGVLDCPELPLNVSRSYLQTNTYVSKVSAHIVKKVADKLNSMLANEREEYEKIFDDIRGFIEYASLRDRKFYDRVKGSIMLTLTDKTHVTIPEYLEAAKETNENKIYYATDVSLQSQYISMLEKEGVKVALMDHIIDTQFASMVEMADENKVKFLRVDSDIADVVKKSDDEAANDKLEALFKKVANDDKLTVKFKALKDDIPAILNVSEESRRMEEMMKMYSIGTNAPDFAYPLETTLVINTESALIKKLEGMAESEPEKAKKIASYIYKLSLLSQKKFSPEEMTAFLNDGFAILSEL